MSNGRTWRMIVAALAVSVAVAASAQAQQKKPASAGASASKPNILIIWGDDIGGFNCSGSSAIVLVGSS